MCVCVCARICVLLQSSLFSIEVLEDLLATVPPAPDVEEGADVLV